MQVPTGNILVVEGELGPLEIVSLGDYGKEVNLKADFLGLQRDLGEVKHTTLLPLTEKWVITISTQYGCSQNCKFCSPAGTKVNTPFGEQDIETLKPGNLVLGFNEQTQTIRVNEIAEVFERNYSGELICIALENGKSIKLTVDHDVYTQNGLKKAAELTEKDEIISF